MTLSELAALLGAKFQGDGQYEVSSIATLEQAKPNQLAFLANSKYAGQLSQCQAGAVLLDEQAAQEFTGNALVMSNPYLGYALAAQLLDTTPAAAEGIHPSSVVHPSAQLGQDVAIGANAVIEAGVVLADGVQVGSGCVVGLGSQIGSNSRLWANVTLYHGVILGQNCIIHSGSVIGSDGFGYANDKGRWVKIPQTGIVVIGDGVEIGSNTSIDRGALDNTVIEEGVIIDNLCQIAHSALIGARTAIAGCTVVAGSTTLGKNCIIGGNTAIAGHIKLADGVVVTGMSRVTKGLKEAGTYSSGSPIQPNKEWRKNSARVRQLDQMARRIKSLEKQLAQLDNSQ